jgi:hypothetical protein
MSGASGVQDVSDARPPVTRHDEEALERSGLGDNGSGQVAADIGDEELVGAAMSSQQVSPFPPFVILGKGRDIGRINECAASAVPRYLR